MAHIETFRHRAAISGYVRDAVSGDGIGGAVVHISAPQRETRTNGDGFYYFLDLDDGSYGLQVSAPSLGSRYGSLTVLNVLVTSDASGRPVLDPRGNLSLSPTRLSGVVRRSDTSAPIAYAEILLRASNLRAKSDKTGQYRLSPAEAGTQTVQVRASGFVTLSQTVSLNVGQQTVVDFSLNPS
jgi:hypothetical protein